MVTVPVEKTNSRRRVSRTSNGTAKDEPLASRTFSSLLISDTFLSNSESHSFLSAAREQFPRKVFWIFIALLCCNLSAARSSLQKYISYLQMIRFYGLKNKCRITSASLFSGGSLFYQRHLFSYRLQKQCAVA